MDSQIINDDTTFQVCGKQKMEKIAPVDYPLVRRGMYSIHCGRFAERDAERSSHQAATGNSSLSLQGRPTS